MALSVNKLAHGAAQVPPVYFDPLWLRTLESMLDQLTSRTDNDLITVEPTLGLRYQGDFYGLLLAAQVPPAYHWVTMRANGFTSPEQYDGTQLNFVKPSAAFFEDNLSLFRTLFRTTF